MTDSDPQAAPPETDRQHAIDMLNHAIDNWADDRLDVGVGTFGEQAMWYLAGADLSVVAVNRARPDALREKVMAAFDDWWDENGGDVPTPIFRKIKAAVAAVLEEQ